MSNYDAILSTYEVRLSVIEPCFYWRESLEIATAQLFISASSLSFFARFRCRRKAQRILKRHVIRIVSALVARDNELRRQWGEANAVEWPSEIDVAT